MKVIINKLNLPDTKMVAKVVLKKDNKVLLLLRKKDQKHPGKWDLPGGHLVIGETWDNGARRETFEETNLKIGNLKEIKTDGRHRFYVSDSWTGEIFPKEDLPEHDDWKWFDKSGVEKISNISDNYKKIILTCI